MEKLDSDYHEIREVVYASFGEGRVILTLPFLLHVFDYAEPVSTQLIVRSTSDKRHRVCWVVPYHYVL